MAMDIRNRHISIDISSQTILKIVVIILAILFVRSIADILFLLFVALVLAAAIDPSITALERRGIPRGFGLAIIYILLIAAASLIVVLLIPILVTQLEQFARQVPDLYQKAFSAFQDNRDTALISSLQRALESLTQSLGNLTSGLFSRVFGFFGGLFAFFGVLVMTFYLTMEEKGMKRIAIDLAPVKYRPYLTQLFNRIEERLGQWLRGQLLLGLIIFVMTLIGLLILQVDYALVLALIAGVTELIPAVGPLIGAVPAILVALSGGAISHAPIDAVWIMLLYLGIQQLENHLIVPNVMARTTGLNPVLVILALLVGAKLAGIAGVILAVPSMLIIMTFVEDFLQEREHDMNRLETDEAADSPK